jgi:plastocyanin
MSGREAEVIIPTFSDYESSHRYFIPRFVKIQKGEFIKWTNLDDNPHRLAFYEMLDEGSRFVGTLGPIPPKSFLTKQFSYDVNRIDYYCDIHQNESGSVIIFSQNEERMSNTETLRFLSRIFNINPPDVYGHLRG